MSQASGALSPPRAWNWSGVGLAAERAAGQEVPLGALPAARDAGWPGSLGIAGGVGDVVRHRVGDRRVGVERLLGGGDVDALRQLEHLLAAAVEADQQLARDVGGVARRVGSGAAAAGTAAAARTSVVMAISFRMVPG